LAVLRTDLKTSRQNIWIIDIDMGKSSRLTNDSLGQSTPIWSPDGKQILYVSFRGNYRAIYRRAWDGTGSEELLFRHTPGAELFLTDVSPDGKSLACDSGGVLLIVPLTNGDALTRTATEFLREEFEGRGGRFSPDGRFLAYASNEANPGRTEVYVRTFHAATGTAGQEKWQVSKNGSAGLQAWRADGKEFFFRQYPDAGTDDFRLMSAAVSTTPMFQAEMPKMLFKLPGPIRGNLANISRDGQRFVFVLDVPADAPRGASLVRK
jgi:Tol biopolymer transport system component